VLDKIKHQLGVMPLASQVHQLSIIYLIASFYVHFISYDWSQ